MPGNRARRCWLFGVDFAVHLLLSWFSPCSASPSWLQLAPPWTCIGAVIDASIFTKPDAPNSTMPLLEVLLARVKGTHAVVSVELTIADEDLLRRRVGQFVDPFTGHMYVMWEAVVGDETYASFSTLYPLPLYVFQLHRCSHSTFLITHFSFSAEQVQLSWTLGPIGSTLGKSGDVDKDLVDALLLDEDEVEQKNQEGEEDAEPRDNVPKLLNNIKQFNLNQLVAL